MFQLRDFVNERLCAAAMEIFGEVEKTIALYQVEFLRSRDEVDNLRKQLDLLRKESATEPLQDNSTVVGDGCDLPLLQDPGPSTSLEMGEESNFSLRLEVPGPSQASADTGNKDWGYCMLQTDLQISQIKEEREELGVDSQEQDTIFPSPDFGISEQDQPKTEFTHESQPLSPDCSAAQSENSDNDEDWVKRTGVRTRSKKRKAEEVRNNGVDGETVDCGFTDAMVGILFSGSFENGESACKRLPVVFALPTFPCEVQMRLDAKHPCHKVPKLRNTIIRGLYEMMAAYTMYPTNAEYVRVAKALIMKYPFLRDTEGNGYHTWHMSLKRKFKAERAPLVGVSEVRKLKEKFGHAKQPRAPRSSGSLCRRSANLTFEMSVGEDSTSVEAQVSVLQSEYRKTHPDIPTVKDCMARTFCWRRREIMDGMPVEDVLKKYPFLRVPAGVFEEVDRIHASTSSFCHRFKECFASVLPNVLKFAKGKSPLAKQYMYAREDALAKDLAGIDFRAGLILLPSIFREKIGHFITMGEGDPAMPYPTIHLVDNDWKMAIAGRGVSVVKVDGVDVCQCTGLDEAFMTAFGMYFAFNIAYPLHLKNTMTFLQRRVVGIVEEGDKPLSVTLLRVINLLC